MSTTTAYTVTGMTCEHCVRAVRTEVGQVPEVRDVQGDLVTGQTSHGLSCQAAAC